jgi:hypothetical protein
VCELCQKLGESSAPAALTARPIQCLGREQQYLSPFLRLRSVSSLAGHGIALPRGASNTIAGAVLLVGAAAAFSAIRHHGESPNRLKVRMEFFSKCQKWGKCHYASGGRYRD